MEQADRGPDIEANDGEEDGLNSEDKSKDHGGRSGIWSGAGRPVSDPDCAVDDEEEVDRDGDV